jgi:hypothetical protein
MRILEIGARNFLSFDEMYLELDPRLTGIVGPNGSGKSNLARILRMSREVLLQGGSLGSWAGAGRLGRDIQKDPSVEARLKVELDRVEERVALAVFIRYALRPRLPAGMGAERVEFRAVPFFQLEENMKRAKAFGVELRLQWRWSEPADMTVRFRGEMESGEAAWDFTWDRAKGLRAEDGTLRGPCEIAGIEAIQLVQREGDSVTQQIVEPQNLRVPPGVYPPLEPLEVSTTQSDPEAQQELARGLEPLGLPWEGIHSYNLYPILGGLLRWKVWITDNIRPWPAEEWALDEKSLWGSPSAVDLSDGRMLPLYLLRLSHGGREERERFQRILERFKELTGQKAAVRVRWEKPPDKQRLRVEIVLEDRLGDIPIRFAGAGMWEALVLSALLAEEDKVLVLDEPALNLHPPLQRRILKALRERKGQVILITHSPYMIPLDEPQDLRRIFRFYKDEKEGATRIRTVPEEAGEADLREMLRWFRGSADVAAFLLAGGVILTEGETESGALPIWWRKSERVRRRGGPEERALAVWSVGGYPGFQRYIRLLKAWGIPWAAVVDGEHVRDVLKANRDALGLKLQETEIDQKGESEIREIAEQHGIFTLNQSLAQGEKFESLPFVAPCLNQARSEVGDSKVLQGAWIAERTDPPPEVEELYEKIHRRLFPEP